MEVTPPSQPVYCAFNDEYQATLDTISDDKILEEYDSFEKLAKLARDFKCAALQYGKVIISERYLPDSAKTLRPSNIGGFVGGDKYVVAGILFKFVWDRHNAYKSDRLAAKEAGHQLKGIMKLQQCDMQGVRLPLMLVIDYRGFRLLATSLLPISHATLVFGTSNGGDELYWDVSVANILAPALRSLNLQPHWVLSTDRTKCCEYYGPADMEIHRSPHDNKLYVVDVARLFPPEIPLTPDVSYTVRLFRPEFVNTNPEPLSSDALSCFGEVDHQLHNGALMRAQIRLFDEVIPSLAADFNALCRSRVSPSECAFDHVPQPSTSTSTSNEITRKRLSCGCYVGSDGVSRVVAVAPDETPKLVLGDVGYMGFLHTIAEPVLPSQTIRVPMPPVTRRSTSSELTRQAGLVWVGVPYDPSALIHILHARGVNMRHAGKVCELVQCELWRQRLVCEMVARVLKSSLRHEHRHEMKTAGVASSEPYRLLLVRKLNRMFGSSEACDRFWNDHVMPRLWKQFSFKFTPPPPTISTAITALSTDQSSDDVTDTVDSRSSSIISSSSITMPHTSPLSHMPSHRDVSCDSILSSPQQQQQSHRYAMFPQSNTPTSVVVTPVVTHSTSVLCQSPIVMPSTSTGEVQPSCGNKYDPIQTLFAPPSPTGGSSGYGQFGELSNKLTQTMKKYGMFCETPMLRSELHVEDVSVSVSVSVSSSSIAVKPQPMTKHSSDSGAADPLKLLSSFSVHSIDATHSEGSRLKASLPMLPLFKRLSTLFGIQLSTSCQLELDRIGEMFLSRSSPFAEADVKDAKALIKQTPFTRYVQGTKAFIQALLDPDSHQSNRLGVLARNRLDKALAMSPTDPHTLANYAFLMETLFKDPGVAQMLYVRSITDNPTHLRSLYYLALFSNRRLNNPEFTETMFLAALAVDPKHCNTLKDYAGFKARTCDDVGSAIALLQRSLAANPTHKKSLTDLAELMRKEGDVDGALQLLYKAVECYPDDKWAHELTVRTLLARIKSVESQPETVATLCHDHLFPIAMQLAQLCLEKAQDWYRGSVVVATDKTLHRVKYATGMLLDVAAIATDAVPNITVARTIAASVAVFAFEEQTVKRVIGLLLSRIGDLELACATYTRVHSVIIHCDNGGPVCKNYWQGSAVSLLAHAQLCSQLSKFAQAVVLLRRVFVEYSGDGDVLRTALNIVTEMLCGPVLLPPVQLNELTQLQGDIAARMEAMAHSPLPSPQCTVTRDVTVTSSLSTSRTSIGSGSGQEMTTPSTTTVVDVSDVTITTPISTPDTQPAAAGGNTSVTVQRSNTSGNKVGWAVPTRKMK